MVLIMGPAIMILFVRTALSPLLAFLVHWLPSGLLAYLIQMSLFKSVDSSQVWTALGVVWLSNIIVVGAIMARVRYLNQKR